MLWQGNRKKNTYEVVNEKRKTQKGYTCFMTGSFTAKYLLFDIRMTQEISKGEVGKGKWLEMAN